MKTKDKRKANEAAAEWYAAELAGSRGQLAASRARELISDAYKFHCGEHIQQETVLSWSESWLEHKRPSLTEGTHARYAGVIEAFIRMSGEKARIPIERYTVKDAQEIRSELIATGKTSKSVNLYFKIIRSMFRAAHRSNLIDFNPMEAVESLPTTGETHIPFTLPQIASLLETAKGDWKTLVILGFTTGARLGDVCQLGWKNVDWEQKLLRFRQTKTKKHLKSRDIVLPIHPMLEKQLDSLGAPKSNGALMPEIDGIYSKNGAGGRYGMSRRFLELMADAGIAQPQQDAPEPSKRNGRQGRRQRPQLSFHSFRHTLASILHNAGVTPEVRQKITGHASAAVHQIYTHTDVDTLRGAILMLPEPASPAATSRP